MKKKKLLTGLSTGALTVAAVSAMYVFLYGIPRSGAPEYGTYSGVTVTRFNPDGSSEVVTITQQNDDDDTAADKPFMRFQLAPNMINMIKVTFSGIKDYTEVKYIYTFTMNDGSEKTFYISEDAIAGGNLEKAVKQSKNSNYLTFKNITDGIYFGDADSKAE